MSLCHSVRWWFLSGLVAPVLALAAGCGPKSLSEPDRLVFAQGHQSLQAERYREAEQAFSRVIADNPDSASLSELYYFRGLARLELGNRPGAKSDFRKGASVYGREQTQVYCAVALANLEYEEGRDAEAVSLYRQVLRQDLGTVPIDEVLYRLGVGLQRLGRWVEADEVLARLISEHPESGLLPDARRRFQSTCFCIQVGAFADRGNAERLALKLNGLGFRTNLSVIARGSETLHTVRAGRYRTFQEAKAAAEKLAGHGYATIIKP